MLPLGENKEKGPANRGMQHAIGLGYQFLAAMLLLVGGGVWLDRRGGGEEVGYTLLGVFLALLYCAYEVWKLVRMMNREAEAEAREAAKPPPTLPPGWDRRR
jgi:hypothetical protein